MVGAALCDAEDASLTAGSIEIPLRWEMLFEAEDASPTAGSIEVPSRWEMLFDAEDAEGASPTAESMEVPLRLEMLACTIFCCRLERGTCKWVTKRASR